MHGGAAHRHGAGNLLVAAAAVRRQQYLGAQLRAARLPLLNIVVSSPHFDLAQFDMIKYIHLGLLSEPQVHRKARPVSGLHLRLVAHVPTTACRGRHATPLPRQPILGSSDGPHHRASWLYPTPTRRRPKHRATCCPGKSAHPKMTENQPVKTSVHRFSRLGLWCRLATTKTRAGPSLCQVGHLDRQHTRVFLVGDYAPRKDINEILSRGGSR